MTANLLAAETSPYLLQHKDNPVHWRPWGPEALDEARQRNVPVLLSVGYSACHWCHVMAHESFENPDIAELMNALFVNVKVDREERPDLDSIYQSALQLMGQHGGWPLTMFLTPDGAPFWGGTYFPPQARWGRPGFPQILQGLANAYANEPDKVLENVASVRAALTQISSDSAGGDGASLSAETPDRVGQMLLRLVDFQAGGLQGAPKFPQPSLFKFLWTVYYRTKSTSFHQAVITTLDHMCQGGIYDHLGGGFARYSTDEDWLVPHFEKMLYDNAQLIELLTTVWLDTGSSLYRTRIEETVDWLLREMAIEEDSGLAFAGTLDADSEGEEGRFYVWQADEIDSLLGADAALFKQVYGVSRGGNWEGTNILNRSGTPDPRPEAEEAILARCRAILLTHRETRIRPGRDDKILTDWNAMAVAALARAGLSLDRRDWIDVARRVYAFLCDRLRNDEGRLMHTRKDGVSRHPAVLDDYAQMIRAALTLNEITGDPAFFDQAGAWTAEARDLFLDGNTYTLAARDTDGLIARPRPTMDNATPSGNGVMAENLARLALLAGESEMHRAAASLIDSLTRGSQEERLINQPTALNAFDLLNRGPQIVLVGPEESMDPLRRAAFAAPLPHRTIQSVAPGQDLPEGHPAHGKTQIDGRTTAYVCMGQTCGLPITDPNDLSRALTRL